MEMFLSFEFDVPLYVSFHGYVVVCIAIIMRGSKNSTSLAIQR
jgi:hypothetical protein